MLLSIAMPAYNEEATVAVAVKRVLEVDYPCDIELLVVDDGSRDDTSRVLDGVTDPRLRVLHHDTNRGKTAAVTTAAGAANGDYLIVCDADLEYDPKEVPDLLAPVLAGEADVVYGTRTFGAHNSFSYLYVLGNRLVTLTMNLLFNVYLSDVETCFKLLPLGLYRQLGLTSSGFGMEPEITAKLLRRRHRPYEVPISYRARTRDAGKKLRWTDGVQALAVIVGVRLTGEPLHLRKART
jgi:glycosyltransferase involved in cell wall biosynthesis